MKLNIARIKRKGDDLSPKVARIKHPIGQIKRQIADMKATGRDLAGQKTVINHKGRSWKPKTPQ
jgi:hypothetical protein